MVIKKSGGGGGIIGRGKNGLTKVTIFLEEGGKKKILPVGGKS